MKLLQSKVLLFLKMGMVISILITCNLKGQIGWDDPVPLTDSLSSNINPDIKQIYVNGQEKLFMVWEKSFDTTASAIYMSNIIGAAEEMEVLSDENIHYKNPKIFPIYDYYGENDSIFFLFYELDQSGDKDLFFMVYTSNGSFSDPVLFSDSSGDDKDFECNDQQDLFWVSNGVLKYSSYDYVTISFDEPVEIDTVGCSNPKVGYSNHVLWEKQSDTSSSIMRAVKIGINLWSEPIVVYDSGYAVNLNRDALFFDLFAWSTLTDSCWKLLTYRVWEDIIYELDTTQGNPFDPALTQFVLGVKSTNDYLDYYITFPMEDNGHDEIYINQDPWDDLFTNLSNSGTVNRNPNIFYGESVNFACWHMYNIWETNYNNNWQLFSSRTIMCAGGEEEISEKKQFIKVKPNPFSEEVNLNYTLDDKTRVKIEICDMFGRTVSVPFDGYQFKGEQIVKWSITNNIDPGIYFIKLRKDNELYSQKIIKTD